VNPRKLIRSVPEAKQVARPNKIRLDPTPSVRGDMQSNTIPAKGSAIPARASGSLFRVPIASIIVSPDRHPCNRSSALTPWLTSAWHPKPIAVVSTAAGPKLVAYQHWLEVAKARGDTHIDCMFVADEDDARLPEIEEILGGGQMTVLDKAALIGEYVSILNRVGLCGQNVQKISGKIGRPVGGTAQAARVLCVPGKTEEARRKWIERALMINRLSPEAKAAAREGGIGDHQRALLQAARQPTPTAQLEFVLASVEAARNPSRKPQRRRGPETPTPTVDETVRNTADIASKSERICTHESEQESMRRVDVAAEAAQPGHLALEDSLIDLHESAAETPPLAGCDELATPTSADEAAFAALISAWRAASATVRDRFIEQVLRETGRDAGERSGGGCDVKLDVQSREKGDAHRRVKIIGLEDQKCFGEQDYETN
jgi:hypothetical protein